MDNGRWFKYLPENVLARQVVVVAVGAAFAALIGLLLLVRAINPALVRPTLVMLLPALVFLVVPLGAMAVTSSDYRTTADGLEVHIVGLYTHRIPWAALRYSTVWDITPPRYVNLLMLRRWEKIHVIYVPGLKGFNLMGIFYGLGATPALIVTPDHKDGEALLNRLKHLQHPMNKKKPRLRRWQD